jgi:hypothetical protein
MEESTMNMKWKDKKETVKVQATKEPEKKPDSITIPDRVLDSPVVLPKDVQNGMEYQNERITFSPYFRG